MSARLGKWKVEKTKVKVVFRLQFHATHVQQAGWDKLFISFIPADSGKVTAKTTKAIVRNGTCKWGDPIYETTRLLQDTKTKQYDEKLYKLVVAMGTSRSGILGEATIDLADYADAQKPTVVPLPLHGCDSGVILHVTVQLLTSKTGFREFEQQREQRNKGLSTASDQSSPSESAPEKPIASEDNLNNQTDKVNSRVRFKDKLKEQPLTDDDMGQTEEYGFDASSNTSESLYAEKHETSSTNEIESLKSVVSGDLAVLSLSPKKEKGMTDWVRGWGSESDNNVLANVVEENIRLNRCLEVAESSIKELKIEVSTLQCHTDEIGLEAHKFSQILISEIASGDKLVNEISILKSECSNLKEEIEHLHTLRSHAPVANKDRDTLFHNGQLRWLEALLVLEGSIRDLQNKACYGYHERDLRFLVSDFEALFGVLQELKKNIGKPLRGTIIENNVKADCKTEPFASGTELDTDIYQPELGPLHYLGMPGFVSQEPNSVDSTNAMKEKILELLRELDGSKVEQESLTKKMDQMECYYESLVQELEETQRQLLGELQNLRTEHSTCVYTVSSNKAEMETLRREMNEQILRFTEEKQSLDCLNKELETRAMTAEAALKRARLNYSIAVTQLQKDLELLSSQVVSMYETNENLIKQAFPDPSVQSSKEYPRMTQDKILDQRVLHPPRILKCPDQGKCAIDRSLGGDVLLEDLKRSLHVQEGLYQKVEEELFEVHNLNLHLEVFSKILQETLVEASAGIESMKVKIDELAWQLDLSMEGKELLKQRLDIALDEVCSLNEDKAACIVKCNAVAHQSQMLEADLQNLNNENFILMQKITEMESLISEYEIKYEACVDEKTKLANFLEKELLEKGNLQTSLTDAHTELETTKIKYGELAKAYDSSQSNVDSLRSKLQNMVASYGEKLKGTSLWDEMINVDFESQDLEMKIEIFLHNACEKILILQAENEDLLTKKEKVLFSLNAAESSMTKMKKKFKHEIQNTADKLEASGALVQRFQLELESISKRLNRTSEVEQCFERYQSEVHSHLDRLEVKAQEIMNLNVEFGQEILEIGDLADELGRTNLIVAEVAEEKQALMATLKGKSQENSQLMVELENLRKGFDNELLVERNFREGLESRIEDLTSELNKKNSELLNLGNEQNSELFNLKQMISDLESEKLALGSLLYSNEESLRNSLQESLHSSDLECQLSVMLDLLIAVNVELAFTKTQWEDHVNELQNKNLEVESALNLCVVNEARYKAENTRMQTDLDALRLDLEGVRRSSEQLEKRLEDLTYECDQKSLQLQNFEEQKSEVTSLKEIIFNLESEKSTQNELLSEYEESVKISGLESLSIDELIEMYLAVEIQFVFMRIQSGFNFEELLQHHSCSSRSLNELQKKHIALENKLNCCLANEGRYVEETTGLLTTIDTLRSDYEASVAENRALRDTINMTTVELENYKRSSKEADASYLDDRSDRAYEVENLKLLLASHEEEIENVMVSKTELEVSIEVLKAKMNEQQRRYNDEVVVLKNRCGELSHKLSNQVLKTEEFKNLSIHLKELKDKVEAECMQAREKSEYQAPLTPQQESLRIIFIKEQYETKMQELKHQVSMSKKHNEEMLIKLQDAIDEIEARKKAEALHLKRNEELAGKIWKLEAELQAVISDKREKMTGYDMMKAELDCSLLSLECCKEEKQKVEASLQECNEEKLKITHELEMLKELAESSKCRMDSRKEGNVLSVDCKNQVDATSTDPRATSGLVFHNSLDIGEVESVTCNERDRPCSVPVDRTINSYQRIQCDKALSGGINGHGNHSPPGEEAELNSSREHLALINDNFRAQTLRSSLDHLNDELERMKNENLVPYQDDDDDDDNDDDSNTRFPGLERELMQLRKANEELKSMFPLFKEHPGCGNALERVLALEIELAEALRAKNKSTIQFQSSFLKQHDSEEAIFQSFRDINELIEEMLEMKGRYATMETELKDMHDRYSQLSLKFAEVEGERQKLMMTLKTVRSKRGLLLNRSSSGENS